MKRNTIIEVIIFLYAVLLVYTGISKLIDYSTFKEQLSESPILYPFASLIAILLPWTEFLIVLMMIVPRWRLKGFYMSLGIMTVFTLYVIYLLLFSDKLPCSCGGVIGKLSWPQHIILNTSFIATSLIGIILQRRSKMGDEKTFQQIVHAEQV